MTSDYADLLNNFHHNKSTVLFDQRKKQYGTHKCITCNITFQTREKLFNHLSTHTKCDHEECSFVGSDKALREHKKQEHPDAATQVFNMDDPEVLEAWLDLRRRHYPSSGNVELKRQRQEALKKRGAVAVDKSYQFKDNKWSVKRHKPPPDNSLKSDLHDPLSAILQPSQKQSLGLDMYESSDSESEQNITSKNANPSSDHSSNKKKVEDKMRKFKLYAKILSAEGTHQPRMPRQRNCVMKSGNRRYQPTLLQKLLSKDITNEHNVILQCIRYVTDNNFFDDAPKS